jgi:hypothetical protein
MRLRTSCSVAAPVSAALLGALAAWLIILRPVFRLLREARS